ncbi:MAG: hypothetical protein Q4C02_06755 [Eubacteriales bacterium]|nr:hypothetical protein [Lachnospiraceae bacterium]MDO4417963.1 hypothetical protein [Eubacteriales bacterium]
MKNRRQFLFRLCALAVLLAVAAVMFVIGRGHTVYFDNRALEYGGKTVEAFHKVTVLADGDRVAKLSAGDRGLKEIMGQNLTMTLEITDEEGAAPHAHKVSMQIPYGMDGVVLNLPALMAGLPQDAYLEEFVITAPEEDSGDEVPPDEAAPDGLDTEEFEMGDI